MSESTFDNTRGVPRPLTVGYVLEQAMLLRKLAGQHDGDLPRAANRCAGLMMELIAIDGVDSSAAIVRHVDVGRELLGGIFPHSARARLLDILHAFRHSGETSYADAVAALDLIKRIEALPERSNSAETALPREPAITVNDRRLTDGQAMTMRVAIGMFSLELDGEVGSGMGSIAHDYKRCIREIHEIMGRK